MDKILIHELEVFFRVGVPETERAKPQRLLLTIELELNFTKAARADSLQHTIDYFALSQRLLAFGQDRSWKLIETLAVELAEMIRRDYKPRRVTVQVKKFVIPQAQYVAVRVLRPDPEKDS